MQQHDDVAAAIAQYVPQRWPGFCQSLDDTKELPLLLLITEPRRTGVSKLRDQNDDMR